MNAAALRNGAWALRYCADRLDVLSKAADGSRPQEVTDRVAEYRAQADELDALAAGELPANQGETT